MSCECSKEIKIVDKKVNKNTIEIVTLKTQVEPMMKTYWIVMSALLVTIVGAVLAVIIKI